ncbi:MAG: AsmA-like C-terminal region-containing protein [Saprospiraceae bacterium]
MKFFKWIGLTLLFLLLALVAFVFAAPMIYGDEIRAEVSKQLDQVVDADVVFGDIDLTIFRDFPKLTVVVEDIAVDGRGKFDSLRLAGIGEMAVSIDFWSAIGDGPVQVRKVSLIEPLLNVMVLPDGTTNTDIMRNLNEAAEATAESDGAVSIKLDEYEIVNGTITYDDRQGGTYLAMNGLNHSGSGDFQATQFALDTETMIKSLTVRSGGVPYLRNATVDYDAILDIDMDKGVITLADNALKLNEMTLNAEGSVNLPNEAGDITTDIAFNTPQQDFRALWSVIPATFTQDLTGLKTSGSFGVSGTVKGTYEAKSGNLPGFAIDMNVKDASVQYPDLPKALTGINVKGGARSAGRDLKDLLIDVERFDFKLGANPFSGALTLRQGTTDPTFDLVADGTLDLADLSDAVPMEGVETISGKVVLDIKAKGSASSAQNDLRSIDASGVMSMTNVVYDAVDMPKVEVKSGQASFNGQAVDIQKMNIQAGRSDMQIQGRLTDPFALATETGTLGGNFSITSNTLDANEWLEEPAAAASTTTTPTEAIPSARPFDRFDIAFDANVKKLIYDVYTLDNASSKGSVNADHLTLESTKFDLEGSAMSLSGKLDNLFGYAFENGDLTGNLNFKGGKLDVLKLMEIGVDPSAPVAEVDPAAAEYLELPERMALRVATSVDEILYDNITLSNVKGVIALADQKAVIENGVANGLGGTMGIDGSYAYNGPETAPVFDMKYDIKDASFQQAFEKMNTVRQLAPVAKYMTGNFNTNMVMSSSLGKDMMPDLTSLSADGFINTLNAALSSFGPLKMAGEKLGIKELDDVQIKNTKNWFTIENGFVNVKPFDVDWQGIDATIGGSHGLDQSMDYDIIALIPRDKLGNNVAGAAVNQGLDFLSGQASKLGLNIDAGEFVRVKINLKGSMDDPKVSVKLLGTEGEGTAKDAATAVLKDLAKQAKDSIERVAQARLDAAKAQATAKATAVANDAKAKAAAAAQAEADRVKALAKAKTDKLAAKASAEAKKKAEDAAKKLLDDKARKQAEEAAQKAKAKLKGLFKKPD